MFRYSYLIAILTCFTVYSSMYVSEGIVKISSYRHIHNNQLNYNCVFYKLLRIHTSKFRCSSYCAIMESCLYFTYDNNTNICSWCSWKQLTKTEMDGELCRLQNHTQQIDYVYKKLDIGSPQAQDCTEYRRLGYMTSGLYTITTSTHTALEVYCDMQTDGGGWLVFQRRMDGNVTFQEGWNKYKDGFGSKVGEHWLGNNNIADITSQGLYELRVDLEDHYGDRRYAVYSGFSINKTDSYRLSIGNYHGDAGDSLTYHNGYKWTTYDVDNDISNNAIPNCAQRFLGAWWYKDCHASNLNGQYTTSVWGAGIVWAHFKGYDQSMKFAEMKIRRMESQNNLC